ncbi:MAG TPA: GGDEF domain-containing protein, partial [Candidatus Acidoferrum sp.]|nr:GGDEF domain-containing protein [Candidatus Acidoferrum sp.]
MALPAEPENRNALFWMITGCVLVLAIGAAHALSGPELSFGLLYVIPTIPVAWFLGRNYGLVISLLSAIAWFEADALTGHTYSHPAIRYWNAAGWLAFFVAVTWLIHVLKALDREKGLARLDYLTGAVNRRYLFEVVRWELDRSHRYHHPLAIAYLDLDDFKAVNDRWGHRVGDTILCAVVRRVRAYLRTTDTIARIGGDEFILLFPETDQAAAQRLIPRIHGA